VNGRPTLSDQIDAVTAEADRLEGWARLCVEEHARDYQQRRAAAMRAAMRTLLLVERHQQAFVDLIKAKRAAG
jgi:hypothetical protein